MPQLSIVIPCYNHGQYIDEALKSVSEALSAEPEGFYELIIVNDGSTDDFTNAHLSALAARGYRVINQHNQGLSAARNTGIRASTGRIILPLDADNRIRPGFTQKAISVFKQQPDVAVVYTDAALFGEQQGIRRQGYFNLQRLMLSNFIDACALFRREVWEATGGYDTQMKTGSEDWEFWLHAAFKGYKFYYIPEPLFDYRVLSTSMAHQLNAQKTKGNAVIEHLKQKHPFFLGPQFIDQNLLAKFKASPLGFFIKIVLKSYFPDRFAALVRKGKLREHI